MPHLLHQLLRQFGVAPGRDAAVADDGDAGSGDGYVGPGEAGVDADVQYPSVLGLHAVGTGQHLQHGARGGGATMIHAFEHGAARHRGEGRDLASQGAGDQLGAAGASLVLVNVRVGAIRHNDAGQRRHLLRDVGVQV